MICQKTRGARNWTEEETDLYESVLSNPDETYIETLEQKALKNATNTEVFMDILNDFNIALNEEGFKEKNVRNNFRKDGTETDYQPSFFSGTDGISKLKAKYKELQGKWKKTTDEAKTGSGLAGTSEEKWYELLNPALAETNTQLDDISSAKDTSYLAEEEQDENDNGQ